MHSAEKGPIIDRPIPAVRRTTAGPTRTRPLETATVTTTDIRFTDTAKTPRKTAETEATEHANATIQEIHRVDPRPATPVITALPLPPLSANDSSGGAGGSDDGGGGGGDDNGGDQPRRPPPPVGDPGIRLGWTRTARHTRQGPGFLDTDALSVEPQSVRNPWIIDSDECHLMSFGPTGAGKGRSAIIPTLLEYPGSMVVIDPKGEAAAVTARRRRELGQRVVTVDPFGIAADKADTFNPFDVIAETDMCTEEFSLAFPQLLHPGDNHSLAREPFWERSADDLIACTVSALLTPDSGLERSVGGLHRALKNGDVVYRLAQLLDTCKQLPTMAHDGIGAFLATAEVTRAGILSVAQQHFSIFADPRVSESLADTSFDLQAFKQGEPTTIYLVLPVSRLFSHGALLRLWLSSLLLLLKSRIGKPSVPTLLMIDEAAQLGRLDDLPVCMTLMRGYGVRTWTFWQSLQQLYTLYGKIGDTMLDNCGAVQLMRCNHHRSAAGLGALLGNAIPVSEFLEMARNEQIVLTAGGGINRLELLDYLNDEQYAGCFDSNPLCREL